MQKPKDYEKDLGKYEAESGRIKSELHLLSRKHGIDFYVADFNFYTAPQWQGDEEEFSTRIHYSFSSLREAFARVKRAEKGIEFLLASKTDHNWDPLSASDVISCILNLEDQTRHLKGKHER